MTRLRQVEPLLAAVDCGTSTVKAAIFDCRGRRVAMAARPCPPDPGPQGAVEQDPARLEDAARCALREATRACGARVRSVVALAVTGQRATVFFLDRRGAPLGPGLNWQDLRGAPAVAQFAARFGSGRFAELTGLPCHAVFTIGKLLDLAGREPGRFRHIRHLALVNDYLLSRLAGKAAMPADWSSASLTGLLATGGFQWALPILAAVGLPRAALPDLAPPGRPVGVLSSAAARATGLPAGLPLVTGAGDHQCAGLGAGAIAPGLVEITLGTSAVALTAAPRFMPDPRQRLMCCAHGFPGAWNLEGLQNAVGSALGWGRRLLNRSTVPGARIWGEVEAVPAGSGGLRFLPYLAGSSAPHWDPQATGSLLGVTLQSEAAAVLRALLEGLSFELRAILDLFDAHGAPVREIRVTGGLAGVVTWNRILAGILARPLHRMAEPHATLLGAALLAAVGAGVYPSVNEAVRAMVHVRTIVEPPRNWVDAYTALRFDFNDCDARVRASGLYRSGGRMKG